MSRRPPSSPKHANLVARISPAAKTALECLAERSGRTQAGVIEGLILASAENPDAYYLRSAAINSFTAAALSRVLLGVVAADHPRLGAAIGVVDGVSRGLFGALPPPPSDVLDADDSHPAIQAILDAFGRLDPPQ